MSSEIVLTNENFDTEVLKSDIPVLVDFWAAWCMPCKMVEPIIEEIAEAYTGKLKVGKVNVDEVGDLAARYDVVSIPTLMIFKNGEQVKQQAGAGSRQAIEELFKDLI